MSSETGVRAVTVEVVVGLVFTAALALIFLDIPAWTKVALATFLGIVGFLDFLALTGQTQKWGWKFSYWKRQRRISKRPDLVTELYRLNEQTNQTLYERTAGRFSLALQGVEAIASLAKTDNETALYNEFVEKFSMTQTAYAQIQQTIAGRSMGGRWKTDDFADSMRSVSSHLGMMNLVFNSAYRLVERWPKEQPFPVEAQRKWQGFAREYNTTLHDWKAFTERFDQCIGYGTATQLEYVREIP